MQFNIKSTSFLVGTNAQTHKIQRTVKRALKIVNFKLTFLKNNTWLIEINCIADEWSNDVSAKKIQGRHIRSKALRLLQYDEDRGIYGI